MIRSLHFREFLDLLDIPILIDFLFLHKPLAFSCAASLKTNFRISKLLRISPYSVRIQENTDQK